MFANTLQVWLSKRKAWYALAGVVLAVAFMGQVVALGPEEVSIQGRLHIAKNGEDLASIADVNGLDLNAFLELNDLNPNASLWAGQPLLLPPSPAIGPGLGPLNGIHHVAKNETLHSVALQYGLHPVELAHLNQMAPNEVLFVGQELRVPSLQNWAKMVEQGYLRNFPTHTVQANEDLVSIAERYKVSEDGLRVFNSLGPTANLQAGTTIMIPPPVQRIALDVNEIGPASLGRLVPLKEKWVEVDLKAQKATAYRGMTQVRTMPISSGTNENPTVTGLFRIWAKTSVQDMSQGSRSTPEFEFLDGVPWVQYFYQDFALQGAFWPMQLDLPSSNGNVLLSERDAEWLFSWTTPNAENGFEVEQGWILGDSPSSGTLVYIHG